MPNFPGLFFKNGSLPIILTDDYWVGGTGSWNGTPATKWAVTSGGVGGQPEPTSTTRVHLDANSGVNTITIVTVSPICNSFDCTGFTGTLAGATAMTVFGSLTLSSGMTLSYAGAITFSSTKPGNTITTNTKSLGGITNINGVNGVFQLQDNFTATNGIQITNGALDTNGKTVSVVNLQTTGTGICSLLFGASNITLTNSYKGSGVGTTISAASSTMTLSGITAIFDSKSTTYGTINLTGTGAGAGPTVENTLADGPITFGTFSRVPPAVYSYCFLLTSIVVSNQLTITGGGANSTRTGLINKSPSASMGVACNGATSLTNVDFAGIAVTGSAAPISGTSLGDLGGNSGITFAAGVTRFMVTAAGLNDLMTGIWATSSGGAATASSPLGQDTITIDSNSFASTGRSLALFSYRFMSLDFTNATNSPALSCTATAIMYGNLTLIPGMTTTGTGVLLLSSRTGTQVLTTAGVALTFSITLQTSSTAGLFLPGDLTASSIVWVSGILTDNSHTITVSSFQFALTAATTWIKRGTYILTGTGVVWSVPAASAPLLTLADSGTIKLTNNSTSSKTFAGGGLPYGTLWNSTAGTGTVTISGSNSFQTFQSDASRTTIITAGTTQTINTLTLGAGCTISSTGSTYTLGNNSGTPWASTGTIVSNCNCLGGWVVTGGTDGGGNTGITFI